jgi:NodT family efflux transporter outer membrane factor (OMF) lipoprotein
MKVAIWLPCLLAWAASAGLGGCALKSPPTGADVVSQELPMMAVPPTWAAADGLSSAAPPPHWLASFGDPRLNQLAAEALRHNIDLRAAAARVEAAGAAVQMTDGALYPTLDLAARSSGNATGSSGQLSGAILSASWELDVWGRVRYGQRAAQGELAAREADLQFAQLSIVATLAKAWFLAIEALQQQRLMAEATTAAEQLLMLSGQRERIGVGSELEVTQARANLQTHRDQALQVNLAVAQSRRALEMLLGRYPAAQLEASASFVPLPPPAPLGVPSELLERRPDIIAAERRVAAAFDRVGEAQAARLPRLSLTAALSSISSTVFVLQQRDNPSGGIGATLLAPILDGGALQGQAALRTAEQKLAAAAYAQTAQRAFNEVETALATQSSLAAREPVLVLGLAQNTRGFELEQVRLRIGSRDQRSVAQQQLVLVAAQTSLLRLRTEQRVQRVQLHLALGGELVLAEAP